jgi:tetraacyldisaccharide 4'-kinase
VSARAPLRRGAARLATRVWETPGATNAVLRALLAPASALYGAAAMLRGGAYRVGVLRSRAVDARIVSIGNLRVGGTGKTPLTRWLAREAHARGARVAIVSRGYGGRRGKAHVVGDGSGALASDVEASGDEAVMLARTAGVPVVAGRDRVAAAALAREVFGSALLLCDDAFQHRRLRRDLDIVLVDADERGGLTRLLPAGPLREPVKALRRADVVVLGTRTADGTGGAPPVPEGTLVLRARFAPTCVVRPEGATWVEQGLGTLAGRRVLALSGVARPAPLYAALHDWEANLVNVLEFPDHYAYATTDWRDIAHVAKDVDLVVTTEKDLVKLERFPFARGMLVAIRLGVTLDDPEALLARVLGPPAAPA